MAGASYRRWIARCLARAALADGDGSTHAKALAARMANAVTEAGSWLDRIADALAALSGPTWQRLDLAALAERIEGMPAFDAAFAEGRRPRLHHLLLRAPRLRPPPLGLEGVALPALTTPRDLADWLQLDAQRLAWLVNPVLGWRPNAGLAKPPASHYRQHLHPKLRGGWRLIEAPRPDLQQAQRRLLDGLLGAVPVHEACHGFVRGRSVAGHAAAHAGRGFVVRFDLRDFFASVRASRVHAIWRTLGYPAAVVSTLTALCTTRTPRAALQRWRDEGRLDAFAARQLMAPHLPQGAPTSPALANLCAFRLDLRLEGLALAFDAHYTRYADDLVFSGDASLRRRLSALQHRVAGIAEDEGFRLHRGKTHAMPAHRSQRVGGIVVNTKTNLARDEHDRLKAQLHRCVLHGPPADRPELRAHLLGRIAWARQLNPARGEKLSHLFARIAWPSSP